MNSNIINFTATLLIAIGLSFVFPWWSIMLAAVITGFIFTLKKWAVFFIPFLAVFVYWLIYTYWLSSANEFILANKIAVLLPLGGNAYLLIFLTALLGGIAAGSAGVFGNQLKQLFKSF